MNPEVLEKVLACDTLPTLPAVAARVIELTNDKSVSMKALAETITNDQGLSAKILRTVNSSFYGLRQRCSTINQAIVMLGLSAVKTLALGFSLVQAVSEAGGEAEGFDHTSYWRRALYTGIAGRCIAKEAKSGFEEECFLGGLLQDVGMIALHQALGKRYVSVLAKAAGDHRSLIRHELTDLEVQHPDVGALLAARWRLPDELVLPVKYHERPTAAPANHARIVRAVALGNIAADVLTAPEPAEPLRRFYERAQQWFGLTEVQANEILKSIGAAAREVAGLLQVDAGPTTDVKAILRLARERLVSLNVTTEEAPAEADEGTSGGDPTTTDELTGLPTRLRFEQTMIAAFEQARAGAGPLSVALFEIDGLAEISGSHGDEAGDTVVINVARRIREAFRGTGALVCCYDDGRIGVAMPRTDRNAALRAADKARKLIESEPVELFAGRNAPPTLAVTASVGVAAAQPDTINRFDSPAALTRMTEQAVLAAKKAGKNTMKVYTPAAAAA